MGRSEALSNWDRCFTKAAGNRRAVTIFPAVFSSSVNWAFFIVRNRLTHYRSRWIHWENTWGNEQNKNLTPGASLTQEKLHSQASWWHGHGDSFMDWSPGSHWGLREAPNMSSCIFTLVCAPVWVTLPPVLPHFALWVHSYNQLTDFLNNSPGL